MGARSRRILWAVVAAFGLSLAVGINNMLSLDRAVEERMVVDVNYAGNQLATELARLQAALALLLAGRIEQEGAHARVMRRLDLYMSRLNLMSEGGVHAFLVRAGLEDELERVVMDSRSFDLILLGTDDLTKHEARIDAALQRVNALLPIVQGLVGLITQAEMRRVAGYVEQRARAIDALGLSFGGLVLTALGLILSLNASHKRAHRLFEAARAAQAEADDSRRQLLNAIEAIPDGFALYDHNDRLRLFNERYRELFARCEDILEVGVSFAELMRTALERGVFREAPEDPDSWVARELARHHHPHHREERQIGDGRWIRMVDSRTRDGQIVCVRTDISALRDTQALLQRAEEIAGFGHWYIKTGWQQPILSKGLVAALGPSPDLAQRPVGWLLRHVHAEDRPALRRHVRGFSRHAGLQAIELRLVVDGETRYIHALTDAELDAEGRLRSLFGVVKDLTARRRMELALRESERRFRLVVQATHDGIWQYRGDDGSVRFSSAFKRLLGYGADELEDELEAWGRHVGGADWLRFRTELERCLSGDQRTIDIVLRCFSRRGSEIYVQCNGIREDEGPRGRPLIIGAVTDITRRRQWEEELKAAKDAAEQAVQTRTRFLAMISHEVRTPINGVTGMLEALLDMPLGRQQERFATIALDSARALRNVVDDVLDATRLEAGEFKLVSQPFRPHRTIFETAQLLTPHAAEGGVILSVVVDPASSREFMGDSARVSQIVLNYASNALKFTARGSVVIRVGIRKEERSLLTVAVSDTGQGIEPSKHDLLFRPFSQIDSSYRREFGGTGLGLAISKALVEQMGGRTGFDSEPGVGSRFWFEVPLVDGRSGPSLQADALSGHRIGVLHDEVGTCEALAEQLELLGAEVIAGDGQDLSSELASLDVCLVDEAVRDSLPRLPSPPRILPIGHGLHLEPSTSLGLPVDPEELVAVLGTRPAVALRGRRRGGTNDAALGCYRGRRALVAEDSRTNQLIVEAALSKHGMTVELVDNGRDAVERVRRQRFDFVLMDIAMPGMDGVEATRQIRTFSDIPIIGLTAHAFTSMLEGCIAVGMRACITKPFDRAELFDVIATVLPPSGEEDEPADAGGEPLILSPSSIEELRDEHGEEGVQRLIEVFLDEMAGRIAALDKALADGRRDLLRRDSHALKSAAGAFGARRLASLAAQLERHATCAEEGELERLCAALKEAAAATRAGFVESGLAVT